MILLITDKRLAYISSRPAFVSILAHEMDSQEIANTVSIVFKGVWEEFYAWKRDYSRDILARVTSPDTSAILASGVGASCRQASSIDQSTAGEKLWSTGTTRYFVPSVFTLPSEDTLEPIILATPESLLEPHPEFESIPPTSHNIYVGDDSDHMPFIPFSGKYYLVAQ
jgi:hypothetical protein